MHENINYIITHATYIDADDMHCIVWLKLHLSIHHRGEMKHKFGLLNPRLLNLLNEDLLDFIVIPTAYNVYQYFFSHLPHFRKYCQIKSHKFLDIIGHRSVLFMLIIMKLVSGHFELSFKQGKRRRMKTVEFN